MKDICGSAIDWSATGSMMSGVGALVGALAVIYAAKVGRSTFNDWKRQKNESRRIELAEQLLALAYKLKRAFQSIRSPGMLANEMADMQEKLRERGLIDGQTPDPIKRGLATAQATLFRIDHFRAAFDSLLEITPVAKAIFGDEIEKALNTFWEQRAKVSTAAQRYADYIRREEPLGQEGIEREMANRARTEAIFWEGGDENGVDAVADAIGSSIMRMEDLLLPIIRSDV